MVQYRDIQLKQQKKQDQKLDKREPLRIVITDAQGNQSGSGSIWANEGERRIWYMVEGAIQPGQALCRRISDPSIGLGARLGYANHGSSTKEVLEDDLFIAQTGDPTGWSSTSPRDLEPGGIKNLWIYSKVITPLATYPAPSGLFVNVIQGDYPYAGTRKTFAGQINIALTQNPNVGQHYYAGLYLDSANTLQVIYGASVVVASTPTEPAWPAGAFRLSVVRVNHTQTSIDFADDVVDRRMAWSDESSGVGTEDIIRIRTFN